LPARAGPTARLLGLWRRHRASLRFRGFRPGDSEERQTAPGRSGLYRRLGPQGPRLLRLGLRAHTVRRVVRGRRIQARRFLGGRGLRGSRQDHPDPAATGPTRAGNRRLSRTTEVLRSRRMNDNVHLRLPTHASGPAPEAAGMAVILIHGRTQSPADMFAIAERIDLPDVPYIAIEAAGNSWYPDKFMAPLASNQPHLDFALERLEALVVELEERGIYRERIVLL